jgi:transposase
MESDKRRKRFGRQFKLDAVNLLTSGERPATEIARELGIDPNTLYRWKRELHDAGSEAFPGKGHLPPVEEELRRLRRELAEVKEDREILKKHLAFFSKHGK